MIITETEFGIKCDLQESDFRVGTYNGETVPDHVKILEINFSAESLSLGMCQLPNGLEEIRILGEIKFLLLPDDVPPNLKKIDLSGCEELGINEPGIFEFAQKYFNDLEVVHSPRSEISILRIIKASRQLARDEGGEFLSLEEAGNPLGSRSPDREGDGGLFFGDVFDLNGGVEEALITDSATKSNSDGKDGDTLSSCDGLEGVVVRRTPFNTKREGFSAPRTVPPQHDFGRGAFEDGISEITMGSRLIDSDSSFDEEEKVVAQDKLTSENIDGSVGPQNKNFKQEGEQAVAAPRSCNKIDEEEENGLGIQEVNFDDCDSVISDITNTSRDRREVVDTGCLPCTVSSLTGFFGRLVGRANSSKNRE